MSVVVQEQQQQQVPVETMSEVEGATEPGRMRKGAMAARNWVRRLRSSRKVNGGDGDDDDDPLVKDNNKPSTVGEGSGSLALTAQSSADDCSSRSFGSPIISKGEEGEDYNVEGTTVKDDDAPPLTAEYVDRVVEKLVAENPEYEKMNKEELRQRVEQELKQNNNNKDEVEGGDDKEGGGAPTLRSRIRKTSVAVSGGALVSVGAVLMVTPLHPIGHAMAIGGGCLLGTEFEAPRKAAQSARDRIRKLRGKNKSSSAAADSTDDTEEEDSGDGHDETITEEIERTEIRQLYEIGTQVAVLEQMYPPDLVKAVLEEIEPVVEEKEKEPVDEETKTEEAKAEEVVVADKNQPIEGKAQAAVVAEESAPKESKEDDVKEEENPLQG